MQVDHYPNHFPRWELDSEKKILKRIVVSESND